MANEFDLDTVDRLLSTTRAVRKRLDVERPVDPELIEQCLRLAVQAPRGHNLERWHWVVVTDPALRAEIGALYQTNPSWERYRGLIERGEAVGTEANVYKSAMHLAEILPSVPVHLVVAVDLREDDRENASSSWSSGASIFPAVWNFLLAARSRGLGTVLTTPKPALRAEIGKVVGLPDGVDVVALVPVAHYTGETFKVASRRPLDEVVSWNTWGSPRPVGVSA